RLKVAEECGRTQFCSCCDLFDGRSSNTFSRDSIATCGKKLASVVMCVGARGHFFSEVTQITVVSNVCHILCILTSDGISLCLLCELCSAAQGSVDGGAADAEDFADLGDGQVLLVIKLSGGSQLIT